MSDGTKRLITTANGAPAGRFVREEAEMQLYITPSPAPSGTTEQQPSTMLFNFANFEENLSNYPYEPILAELRYTSWEYDTDSNTARWSASLFIGNVRLTDINWIEDGETYITAVVDL